MTPPITTPALTPAELFFYEHAGYSWHTGQETPEHGHVRCARELATAEAALAADDTVWVMVADDPWAEDENGNVFAAVSVALVRTVADGAPDEVIGAVGAVGADDQVQVRVISAELMAGWLAERETAGRQ